MNSRNQILRRKFLAGSAGGLGLITAAIAGCGEVQTVTERVVEVVTKEVPVERVVTREVVKEVPVEVEKEVKVEVEVEKVVEVEKEKIVEKIVTKVVKEAAPMVKAQAVTYWHVWGGPRLPLIEDQVTGFEERNPHIKVRHTLISQTGMDEKYLTAIAGGDPPDVIMLHGQRHFVAFSDNDVLTPLDELMRIDNIPKDTWFDYEVDVYTWDGKMFAAPFSTSTNLNLFFWNKAQAQEVGLDPDMQPQTWSELEEAAEKLTVLDGDKVERVGVDPLLGGFRSNYWFRTWTFMNNGRIASPDRKQVLYNSDEGKGALGWLVDFYDATYGGFENVRPIVSGGRAFRNSFLEGKLSSLFDGIWMFLIMEAQAPDVDWGVAHVPYNDRNPAARTQYMIEGAWGYAIPTGVKNPDGAWEFLKWTTADEGNREFFIPQVRPSPVKEFNKDPRFGEKFPDAWKLALEVMDLSVHSPASPVQEKLNEITLQMQEEALLHKRTPEDAIEWGATESQKEVDKWWEQRG